MYRKLLLPVLFVAFFANMAFAQTGTVANEEGETAAKPFTINDALKLTSVYNARMSPDGTHVLFTKRILDWEDNKYVSRLWMVNTVKGNSWLYTSKAGDGSARWSPNSRWISFTRSVKSEEDDKKTQQIFLIRTAGGEAQQLTTHVTSIKEYEWGPDGQRIFFVANDTLSNKEEKALEHGSDAFRVYEGPNGQYHRGRWANLWVIDAHPDSGAARALTSGKRIIDEIAVGPEGRRVAFTFRTENYRNGAYRSEIAILNLATNKITVLTDNKAPEDGLAWAPNGKEISFMAPDLETWRLDQGNLYVMDLKSGNIQQLMVHFQPGIRSYQWSPNGNYISFTALDSTTSNLYQLDLSEAKIKRLTSLKGMIGGVDFSNNFKHFAFTYESPLKPGDLYISSYPNVDTARVTNVNPWLRSRELVTPKLVHWTSTDGLRIEGLLYLPPDGSAEPGAFILNIHGGPAGVFTQSFDAQAQILAAHGYAILQPNVRGSSGYGDKFLRANMYDIGNGDYKDLMTGVDAMIERGIAHSDSLALRGWSYGGILGGWTITQTDRFEAASLGAMVTYWPGEYGAGFHYDAVRWYIGGTPWTNTKAWRRKSSYTYLDKVSTPTILFHGENDHVDTIQQTMNFFAGLRTMGVPVRFVRFPGEGHGFSEPRHIRRRLVEELRWFQRYVKGEENWEPSLEAMKAFPY